MKIELCIALIIYSLEKAFVSVSKLAFTIFE